MRNMRYYEREEQTARFSKKNGRFVLTSRFCCIVNVTACMGSKPGALSIELRARKRKITHLARSCDEAAFHVCTLWETFQHGLPYHCRGWLC